MSWILLTIFSAMSLGLYDIAKKSALRDNAVAPVLFVGVLIPALLWSPWVILSRFYPEWIPHRMLRVEALSASDHVRLAGKSLLVGSSWAFAYAALKHLPISIAGPLRATSPLWTALIATTWMQERPTATQWAGVGIILVAFYGFSFAGRLEGIHFHRDRWVASMMVATLLASGSALYDKWLLQRNSYEASTVQAWFSIYLVPVMFPLWLRWYLIGPTKEPFRWRPAVVMIGAFLLLADFAYFTALKDPSALITLVSPLRRTSVIVSFFAGVWLFQERNTRSKAFFTIILLVGVVVLAL